MIHGNVTAGGLSKLKIIGVVNAADAIAAIFGTLFGGWMVDRLVAQEKPWHFVLSGYLIWQGVAFVGFTFSRNLPDLIMVRVVMWCDAMRCDVM